MKEKDELDCMLCIYTCMYNLVRIPIGESFCLVGDNVVLIFVVGNIQALKFINPKCKVYRCVLGVSSAGSCVLITRIH